MANRSCPSACLARFPYTVFKPVSNSPVSPFVFVLMCIYTCRFSFVVSGSIYFIHEALVGEFVPTSLGTKVGAPSEALHTRPTMQSI